MGDSDDLAKGCEYYLSVSQKEIWSSLERIVRKRGRKWRGKLRKLFVAVLAGWVA